MSIVIKMPSVSEQRERRLHLREVDEPADATSVGDTLRERRMERGIDQAAIAAKLKMRIDQLKAIECDDFARLPGGTYAVGFIRSYARYLGLDSDALIERYKQQTASTDLNQPVELIFPEVTAQHRWPNGSLLIVALVVAVVIYGIAQVTMPSRPAPATVASASDSVIVVDSAPAPAPAPAQAVPSPAPIEQVNRTASESDTVSAAEPVSFTAIVHEVSALSVPAPIVIAAAVQANESPSAVSRITLKALESTYVQVKDPGLRKPHAILLARVLNPGESFQAPDRAGLLLLTGNAGGVQVEVDGRSAGVLGKSGQVIKRLPLEPAYFLSRIDTSR